MAILERLSNRLNQVSTSWVALIGLIIFLLFTSFVLPAQSAGAEEISRKAGSPDMSFFYTPQELYNMAKAYGEQGRMAYIRARFTFDLIWPLVYTFFLTTAISWTFSRAFAFENRLRWGNLFPIFGMAFDYAENISTSLVMWRFPETLNILARFAPLFTTAKWIFVGSSFILLLMGVIAAIGSSLRRSAKKL